MPTAVPLFLERAEALTFDCYGTLIDWETGLLAALREILGKRNTAEPRDDELLEQYAAHEARLEAGPFRPYRQVLGEAMTEVCARYGVEATDADRSAFAMAIADWPAFADAPAALAQLARRYGLGVITNCDDDLFEHSRLRLGVAFDWVVTAQRAGSYKPAVEPFELAFREMAVDRDRIVHVAQSVFHDHVPARRLGLKSVWINRRHDKPGFGATPPALAEPDLTLPDMASLAALMR